MVKNKVYLVTLRFRTLTLEIGLLVSYAPKQKSEALYLGQGEYLLNVILWLTINLSCFWAIGG